MRPIVPVVLSGGIGTRLWPLSTPAVPKQLARLVGDRSLLQATADRASRVRGAVDPVIVCGVAHRAAIEQQLSDVGITPSRMVVEPVGRNTAPALAAAARLTDPEALLLVLPSDHLIADQLAFARAVLEAAELAEEGHLVTFGVTPDRAETGYGYILAGETIGDTGRRIDAFVEKPDWATASRYVDHGGYVWNSGMFLFQGRRVLAELGRIRPDILAAVDRALAAGDTDGTVVELDATRFAQVPAESIDYAVMETTEGGAMVPLDAGWSDVGSWTALWEIGEKDDAGNVIIGPVHTIDTGSSYLRSERTLAVIGLEDVIVVDTGDAVLVVHKDAAQRVKELADRLREE